MDVNPILLIARWLSKHTLKFQLGWLVIVTALLCVTGLGAFTYHQTINSVHETARQLGQSLARMTATETIDHGPGWMALTNASLKAMVQMDSITGATVFDGNGRMKLRVTLNDKGAPVNVPRDDILHPFPKTSWEDHGSHYSAASLLANPGLTDASPEWKDLIAQKGWVELDYDLKPALKTATRKWAVNLVLSIVLVGVTVWLLLVFVERALKPISRLALFSSNLVTNPGEQVRMRWGSDEVRLLGRTLNRTSEELAERAAAVQQRLARLRNILATAGDAIIGVDEAGIVRSANPAAERMFGYSAEEMLGTELDRYLPGMNQERLRQVMAEGMFMQSTQSHLGRAEMDAMRHGETPFPVEATFGEITGDPEIRYTCIARDLTEAKLAEEYMALYGRVVDCTLNGIMIADARRYPTPVVYVNPAFSRITEFAPYEILGRDPSRLNGKDTDPDDLQLLERTIKEGGELTVTLRQYRKSGAMFHNKMSVSPVKSDDGSITHYIYVLDDVSSQIEVKRRLIERTARLNATFDLSPDGFAVFDSAGELISSNPALRAMVGSIPTWCSIEKFDDWLRDLCDEPDAYRPISEALKDPRKDILNISRPSPKVIEREIRRNLGGSAETFLYFRDVTHQKEVDRIKSEFLATAAHELRTPLASILGFTELMMHRKYSDEKRLDLLQTVHRQGTLLSNLIQELLDLSRIEARQGKDFQIQPCPIAQMVQDAVESVKDTKHGRSVQVGEIPEALAVMADAAKAQQCLINLISNAFKYSPDGGDVLLNVSEERHNDEDMVVVRIKDHGLGLTPSQLARVFERFYRADGSGNIPGTGLGLNLVKEIVEILGGSIELESEHGKGTTAILRLRKAELAVASEVTGA